MMEQQAAIGYLSSLPRERKARLCALLCRELTIIGRTAYDVRDRSMECAWLRAINEIQHRLTTILDELLEREREYHDEGIASIFLSEREDQYLRDLLARAFERSVLLPRES